MMSQHGRSAAAFGVVLVLALVTRSVAGGAGAGQEQKVPAIRLSVDAADAPRRILHVRQVVPSPPGLLSLVYPKWIPGEHGPIGPINDLVDLKLTAGEKVLPWRRDEVDLYTIRCDVPTGADQVVASFNFLTPSSTGGLFSAGASASAKLAVISWNQLLLYPQGKSPRELRVAAELTVPAGWKIATALPIAELHEERATFGTVSLETLVDSPVQCGQYLKDVPIGPSDGSPHFVHIACDSPDGLKIDESFTDPMVRLVAEARAMFGSRHYRSYHWLLTLSDHVTHFGLEHHECSDNRAGERFLLDDDLRLANIELLPHEYIHSWNGKYRRPADMATKDYQEPERTRLLWIYEGLTQYLELVLSARSGLCSDEEFRDTLALYVQDTRNDRGRAWRPLDDVALSFHLFDTNRSDGAARRRSAWDVYVEGALVWLEADCIIREQTKKQRSLDDFCARFFGGSDGPPEVKTYLFDDVVAGLNAVAPFDWGEFLTRRTAQTSNAPLTAGIERAGWKLGYASTPSRTQDVEESAWEEGTDLSASIGITVKDDGAIVDVVPDSAADRAGIGPGMKIVEVNTRRFTMEVLRAAIAATEEEEGAAIELLMENADYLRTYPLDYRGGEKYPRLERDKSKPDLLGNIIEPRAEKKAGK